MTNYSMWSRSHKQPGSRLPHNITRSNTEVLPARVGASPVSDSPCGFVDRVLWGALIRARRRDPLSSQGSAHERRFIKTCEVDLWLIEGLIFSPLVFIRVKNGGKAGGVPQLAGTASLPAPVPSDQGQAEWSRCIYPPELETLACWSPHGTFVLLRSLNIWEMSIYWVILCFNVLIWI